MNVFVQKSGHGIEADTRADTEGASDAGEDLRDGAGAFRAEKGYEATTMRDVAREAGASLGLAYRYYASKE